MPCSVLNPRDPPGANKEVKIVVTPNTKILYWAAEPKNEKLKEVVSWKEAYAEYENAGVAVSNGGGEAVLKVRAPQSYNVPFQGKLPSHIHYRVCGESGWLGHVQTIYLNEAEPFEQMDSFKSIDSFI
jgi:protocatechuate 3,4-dioxygenase beta subunit